MASLLERAAFHEAGHATAAVIYNIPIVRVSIAADRPHLYVTGSRRSWLKAEGEIQRYDTREQAEAEAARLAQDRNSNPHRTATFNYTVRRLLKVA